jgi:hypothetical protein
MPNTRKSAKMALQGRAKSSAGTMGFTLDDIHEVVWKARKKQLSSPENTSCSATVSGPCRAAKRYTGDVSKFLS